MEIAIKRHVIYLKANRKSEGTIEQYSSHLGRLRVWLQERDITSPKAIKRVMLEEWVAGLHDKWAPATVKQAVAAARSFFKWCNDTELISRKQSRKLERGLKLPKVKDNPQRTLSIDEIEQLLDVCNLNTPKGQRDAALICILIDTGLRASEVCRLRVDAIEFEIELFPGVVVNRLLVGVKGGVQRYGYFGKQIGEHLKTWLRSREEIAQADVEQAFVSLNYANPGIPFDRHTLKKILRDLGKKAGVQDVCAHAFRRAFACILEMAGASTREVMEMGRWENLEMVILYTRDYKAAKQYNRFAPLDFMTRLRQEDK
jgi:site-specific recombinase XerD